MSSLSVSIIPNPSLLAQAFVSLNLPNFLRNEVNSLAFLVERNAKQLTPVNTGRLRASIFTSPSSGISLQATVSTNTDYAIYVHEGTKYMRGRPFMTEGAALAQIDVLKGTRERLDQEFTKAFKTL